MINDLRAIECAMGSHGMGVAERHPNVKDMARGTAFRVRLSSAGLVAAVEIIPDAGRGAVWTLRDAQHNGFPGLKTTAALLSLDPEALNAHLHAWDAANTPKQRRIELLRLLETYTVDPVQMTGWPSAGHRRRIAERLHLLRPLASDPQTAAVPAAFERFLISLAGSPSFLESLAAWLAENANGRDDEWVEAVYTAVVGPAALAIDVEDLEFARDAGDARQIGPVTAALGTGAQPVNRGGICALSGKVGNLHFGNAPQPNLPGLGQTYLFARNKDIPSLTRYGHTADASFPIDSNLFRRLSGVITSLTEPDAKGRSWRLIPAETGDKPDLLVTSLRGVRAADAMAEEEEETIDGQTAWNELGAQLIRQMRGEETSHTPLDEVVILVLRTVDPANRKAIYRRSMTAVEIWEAACRWQSATANTPPWFGFRFPVKGEKKGKFQKAPFVKPLSITPLSRVLYSNGGRRRVAVIGVTAADALGLFLGEGERARRAARLLPLLLQRHGSLLSGIAAANIRGSDSLKAFDPKTDLRRDALRSVTWIGVLLSELGRFSLENADMPVDVPYTDDLAFRLGQFLAAADYIHKGYCADLRGGDLPPTLLGNSVLAIAGSDPTRALAILLNRLKPYLAWAKHIDAIYAKAQAEEKQGNTWRAVALRVGVSQARKANHVAEVIRNQLAGYGATGRKPDDAFKAELLLGYMAGFPPTAKRGDGTGPAAAVQQDDEGHGDQE